MKDYFLKEYTVNTKNPKKNKETRKVWTSEWDVSRTKTILILKLHIEMLKKFINIYFFKLTKMAKCFSQNFNHHFSQGLKTCPYSHKKYRCCYL